MNRKFFEADYEAWANFYLEGNSCAKVAEKFGVKVVTVKKTLGLRGILRSFSEAHRGREPWNKGASGLQEAWNKGTRGLSKGNPYGFQCLNTDPSVTGILCFIEYQDEDGNHLKVGITCRTIRGRYGRRHIRTIAEFSAPLGECFVAEQAILAEAERRGWRRRSSTTTELIHPDGYSEVREWVLQGGLGDSQV